MTYVGKSATGGSVYKVDKGHGFKNGDRVTDGKRQGTVDNDQGRERIGVKWDDGTRTAIFYTHLTKV